MNDSKRGFEIDRKVVVDEKPHWCFRNFNQIPIWLVGHILIFCVILYSSYVCWACVVLSIWEEYCNKESTHYSYGYVLTSVICLVLTISSACYVGFYVGDNNLWITILALVVDLLTLAMTIWGIILYFQRNENTCGHKYSVEAPSFFIFFNATFAFWMFHFVVVAMLINCVGHIRFKYYSNPFKLLTEKEILEGGNNLEMLVLERLDAKRRNQRQRRSDVRDEDYDHYYENEDEEDNKEDDSKNRQRYEDPEFA